MDRICGCVFLKTLRDVFFRSIWWWLFLWLCLSANIWVSCGALRSATDVGPDSALRRDSLLGDCPILFRIEQGADFFGIDELFNCYLAMSDGRLLRYDSSGVLRAEFGDFRRGSPSDLDLSDPLRPLVFYGDFSEVLVLDTRLTELFSLSLREVGLAECTAICRSRDRGYWAYEAAERTLYKLGERAEVLLKTEPLDMYGELVGLDVRWMRASKRYLVLCDEERGLAVFDFTGRFLHFTSAEGIQSIQLLDGDVYLLTLKGELFFYLAEAGELRAVSLPCGSFEVLQAMVEGGRWYVLFSDGIIVLEVANIEGK